MTAPATFIAVQGGNDLYWRLEAPARAIGAKELIVPEDGGYYMVAFPNDDTAFKWSSRFRLATGEHVEVRTLDEWNTVTARGVAATESWATYPEVEGTVVWTRPDLMRASHAIAMRKNGTRTLAEVDDNYFCPPSQNIFLKGTGFDDKGRLEHAKAVASMDGIVFSTQWLQNRYYRELKKRFGRNLPEMFVCRNNVAADDWPEPTPKEDRLRVGWMGSPSHVWDVDIIWAALMHARNLGAQPVMIGHNPCEIDVDVEKAGARKSQAKIDQWKKVGLRHVKWVAPDAFRRTALPLDIGLAPLQSTDFTQGKSDVKAIEYVISGAAPILQNMPVYNRDWVHGETCLLAGSDREFLECTELLIRDANLRERILANAQQYVREERGLKQLRGEWTATL